MPDKMAFLGGVLGVDRDGEWIRPRLGHAVVELLPATTERRDARLPDPWTLHCERPEGAPHSRGWPGCGGLRT
ncbi:hypothetical protein [Streptomyces platensis]|uniref:hypothetical protein n=1 Tax=Streptomyces platensis TaxID=58346 RepID=UPI003331A758